jgi:hypothetical protein
MSHDTHLQPEKCEQVNDVVAAVCAVNVATDNLKNSSALKQHHLRSVGVFDFWAQFL